MKICSFLSAILAASLLVLGCAQATEPIHVRPGVPMGIATIVNGGSTNASGYLIKVYVNGQVTVAMNRPFSTRTATVSRKMASDLFGAIHASQSNARPSGAAMCMKSTSFGSTMRVEYGTWHSVDLNCPVAGANAALKTQVGKVLAALKVSPAIGTRPVTLPTNEPRRIEPSVAPMSTSGPLVTPQPTTSP